MLITAKAKWPTVAKDPDASAAALRGVAGRYDARIGVVVTTRITVLGVWAPLARYRLRGYTSA